MSAKKTGKTRVWAVVPVPFAAMIDTWAEHYGVSRSVMIEYLLVIALSAGDFTRSLEDKINEVKETLDLR